MVAKRGIWAHPVDQAHWVISILEVEAVTTCYGHAIMSGWGCNNLCEKGEESLCVSEPSKEADA